MSKLVLGLLLAVFTLSAVVPSQAVAGGHAGSFNLNLSIQSYRPYYPYPRPFYPRPYYGYGVRPVCPIGILAPGCFAPVRKSAFFVGAVGWGIVRGVARGVAATGRFLFGRRYWY